MSSFLWLGKALDKIGPVEPWKFPWENFLITYENYIGYEQLNWTALVVVCVMLPPGAGLLISRKEFRH